MPSTSEIIAALQFASFNRLDAINGTGDPARVITYQFDNATPSDNISGYTNWQAWTQAQKNAVIAALDHIETFLNVDFVLVTGNVDPDLNLGRVSLPGSTAGIGGASISYSGTTIVDYDGYALFDTDPSVNLAGNVSLILHEIGHALGLAHPFDGVTLDPAYDNAHYTLMSYADDPLSGEDNDAMMLFDVLALQNIWGAAAYNTGNTRYTGPRTDNVDTVWDTGGTDTFDASARGNAVRLDLREGRFSTFGSYEDVAIAYGVKVENATGGIRNDTLIGNALANLLSGRNGADLLLGNGGRDKAWGGNGKDVVKGGGGNDLVGGNAGNDKLYGGWGSDKLLGGTGADKLWGDGGADTFCFLSGFDRDVVWDFEDNVDTLRIVGLGTRAEVLALATESNGDTFFDFGGGDLLIVRDMSLAALQNDLVVI